MTPGTNRNVSHRSGNEAEPTVAIDPIAHSYIVIASNTNTSGILTSVSTDNGATWDPNTIANNTDNLSPACCDASASYDSFENLWLVYLGKDGHAHVTLSTDNGT